MKILASFAALALLCSCAPAFAATPTPPAAAAAAPPKSDPRDAAVMQLTQENRRLQKLVAAFEKQRNSLSEQLYNQLAIDGATAEIAQEDAAQAAKTKPAPPAK